MLTLLKKILNAPDPKKALKDRTQRVVNLDRIRTIDE